MNFWNQNSLNHYDDLTNKIESYKKKLGQKKQLVHFFPENSENSLAFYLACLQSGNVPLILDPSLKENTRNEYLKRYPPSWLYANDSLIFFKEVKHSIHNDLAICLTTSGSVGDPKLVRLSYKNLQSNAKSIALYLDLNEKERPITTLPFSYSYGLSVINSHLLVNAKIIFTKLSLIDPLFWELAKQERITSIAGVPFTYQMLKRLDIKKLIPSSLKILTQAGGKLDSELAKYFHLISKELGIKFFIMYGQTEATARISYVPHTMQTITLDTIGIPIPFGKMWLDPITSELLYEGPNVMMGYAETLEDLSKGKEVYTLKTGDLAIKNIDGTFSITGRLKRFIKINGIRLSLDIIEEKLKREGVDNACIGNDQLMKIFYINTTNNDQIINNIIHEKLGISKINYKLYKVNEIKRLPNGKIDYAKLAKYE